MTIRQLVYSSQTKKTFTIEEIDELLESARDWNAKNEVTGVLLYSQNGNVVQLIEGQEETITSLFARISTDTRHTHISVLADQISGKRCMPDWAMGFGRLDHASKNDAKSIKAKFFEAIEANKENNTLLLMLIASIHDAHSETNLKQQLLSRMG